MTGVLLRLEALVGFLLVLLILWDGFETMVLTRTVSRRWRVTGLYYFLTRPQVYGWLRRMTNGRRRHALLTAYPPLSLFVLFSFWAGILMIAYAMIYHGLELSLNHASSDFFSRLYFSGVTFLTLGYGDLTPREPLSRTIAVAEAANGFLFLALIISYLPVFYGAIQRREIAILKLDSRAGSMPSGHELFHRHAEFGCLHLLPRVLAEYEVWGAELLEAYLSYPVLSYYRSQHDEQSWLMTATAILDACALIESACEERSDDITLRELRMQAHSTRAILRHVLVDLAYILRLEPDFNGPDRMTRQVFEFIHGDLVDAGIRLRPAEACWERIVEIRREYEPYAKGIGQELLFALPAWGRAAGVRDNWEIAAWDGQSHGPDGGSDADGDASSKSVLLKPGGAG